MIERRTPRAHLQSAAVEDDPNQELPVTEALVEALEARFPVRLSQIPNTAETVLQDQARMMGQREVIDYLRNLLNNGKE